MLLAWLYVSSEQQRVRDRAQLSAQQLDLAVDRELAAPTRMLQALATSPLLQAGDLQTFYERASELARGLGVTVVLRAPGSPRQLVNTSAPWGTPPEGDNPDILALEEEAARAQKPVISDLIRGSAHDVGVVVVMVPVLRDGRAIYVLSARLPADRIATALRDVRLDPDWFSVVVDRNNMVVARLPDHEQFVGKPAPPGWNDRATGMDGMWIGRNLEDVAVHTAYVRSPRTGWMIAVGAPDTILNAPLRRALLALTLVGTVILSVTSALAYRSADTMARAVRTLSRTAHSVFQGEPVAAVETPVREVNDVSRALEVLAEGALTREAHLQSILDTVPSAMIVADSRGTIRSFSKAAERLFGYSAEEAIGRNVSMLMPEPDQGRHDSYINRHLATGERRIIGVGRIVSAMRKDGTILPVELHIGEADAHGEKVFTGFLRDQSEKLRIEQELRQTQKMEAIGKLTGGVAHDFNNLLTVIKGNLEMLDTRVDGERPKALLKDAQEATDLAAQLTASLLAFGRRMPLAPKLADVGQLVSGTADLLRRTLGETISVRTVIDSSCNISVDIHQLQNALLNLGINARDAMQDGGKLTIEVSQVELDAEYRAQNPDVAPGAYTMIAVTDTGTGMSPEVRDRAFEPFFTTKPATSGTGLGLSTVYGFVKQSGGHISIYSELGHGTTVRIYLPCVGEVAERAPHASASTISMPRAQGETILLVEDEARVRRITKARLTELGYNVLEAESGPAALQILAREPVVDLLFTDMIMPGGMTGSQLAAEVRHTRPDLPVLFASGYADPDMVKQASVQRGNWLAKPYRAAELAQKLRAVLDQPMSDDTTG